VQILHDYDYEKEYEKEYEYEYEAVLTGEKT
jgi:hypothetical protein